MKEWEGWGIYEIKSLFRIIWGNNWGGGGGVDLGQALCGGLGTSSSWRLHTLMRIPRINKWFDQFFEIFL